MAGTGVFGETLDGDVYKYYSDGEWKKSSSGKSVSIINPTTRKTQYKVQGNQLSTMFVITSLHSFDLFHSLAVELFQLILFFSVDVAGRFNILKWMIHSNTN